MDIYINPDRSVWKELTARCLSDDPETEERVREILERVRTGGDMALREITTEIDKQCPEGFEVDVAEVSEAVELVDVKLKDAIRGAESNIRKFHEAQLRPGPDMETMPGVRCLQRVVPIDSVGLYIPGGTAPLFSTVLMLAVPAAVAGCREIVMCTPAGQDGRVDPAVLFVADLCGVNKIYKLGGAQAIGAMAYGTQTVPAVDKIFGPGNRYVTKAKQLVSVSDVAIDMPAGPSEVMVLCDGSANSVFTAADLLAQAEHGTDSQAILVCNDPMFAEAVREETLRQLELLPRSEIARQALENSRLIVFPSVDQIVEFANRYAPEHLIISMSRPWEVAERIVNAGSIFIGKYSPESVGDYASGTNHTLPTAGWARSCGGVSTDSFVKKITVQELSKEGLRSLGPDVVTMAEAEGLTAHANAVRYRLDAMDR